MNSDDDVLNSGRWVPSDGAYPSLDEGRAQSLIGKYLLVGITWLNTAGQPIERRQVHGEIIEISLQDGLIIRQPDGNVCSFPPVIDLLEDAAPGIYRLHGTGEEVENPDLVGTLTVRPPGN